VVFSEDKMRVAEGISLTAASPVTARMGSRLRPASAVCAKIAMLTRLATANDSINKRGVSDSTENYVLASARSLLARS
jgi:hypothetical protein